MSNNIIVDYDQDSQLKIKLREIFNQYNPINIYYDDIGNIDEYDLEIKESIKKFNTSFSVDDFANKLHKIFIDCFDKEIAGSLSRYNELAKEVYCLLEQELNKKESVVIKK